MLITAICPTFNRPELLGRAIYLFKSQTYCPKRLIIVDDLGQYDNCDGNEWELVSFPRRCLSLGEKNNICAALAHRDTYAYVKWDDDDIYMPWHLEQMAEAFKNGADFVQPRIVMDTWDGELVCVEAFSRKKTQHFCYHGAWGYTRELFKSVGGYRAEYAGDDGEFQRRLIARGVVSHGFDPQALPSYIYNRPLPGRISERGGSAEAYFGMVGDTVEYWPSPPRWTDDSVLDFEIPKKVIQRPW